MSIYKNGKLIAGGRQCMPLLSFMWADHILNDASWLRADTFSWQPGGGVYIAVYAHLTADITGKTLQSETISGTTIQFYLADDGHKICPASQESNVLSIYNATGVAWYYIIDTTNQRFKLPRTKFGFTGIRSGVGGYVEAGLPNITGRFTGGSNYISGYIEPDGAFSSISDTGNVDPYDGRTHANKNISFSASRSSSIYGNSDTVQPKATEMYLYFYVGNFTQTALENTAGVTTEVLNTKVTIGHEVIEFQAPTAANNYTWYRKYADGWVEQGGYIAATTSSIMSKAVSLPITMANSNYQVSKTTHMGASTTNSSEWGWWGDKPSSASANTTTTVYLSVASTSFCMGVFWQVNGLSAN